MEYRKPILKCLLPLQHIAALSVFQSRLLITPFSSLSHTFQPTLSATTMELQLPPPPENLIFNSNTSSPYITAPSSPHHLSNHFFFSAPTSPSRSPPPSYLNLPEDFDLPRHSSLSSSSIPFLWEHKPGIPKSSLPLDQNQDFEFNLNTTHLDKTSPLSADELFHCGKIKPLKPPPVTSNKYNDSNNNMSSSSSSPRLRVSHGKRIVQGVFSPRKKDLEFDDFDPFAAAMEEARKSEENSRGREGERAFNSGRKGSRSLSPLRVLDIITSDDSVKGGVSLSTSYSKTSTTSSSLLSSISFTKGYRKWKLKDLLLFRSHSEGRANDKDPLRKYTVLGKKNGEEDVKNLSFRSSEGSSGGCGGSTSRRRAAAVSAHELHYTVNRAAAEEMKKKTFLPYKQGLLGCLGFNHGMHGISRGIGSFARP